MWLVYYWFWKILWLSFKYFFQPTLFFLSIWDSKYECFRSFDFVPFFGSSILQGCVFKNPFLFIFFLSFSPVFQFGKFPLTYLNSHWLFKWLCQIYFCALWRISLFLLLSFWLLALKCYFILSSSFPLCWNYLLNSAFPIFSIRTCITPLKRM